MIGIYGGTFNPVHYGHLRTALEVKELFNLQQLRLIPCRIPVHRHAPEVSAAMRWEMLNLAIANTPGFHVENCEILRDGPSFMVDTLRGLRAELGDTPLALFIGADAFAGLQTWHQWQNLFEFAHIIVMTRPGFSAQPLIDFFQRRLINDPGQLQSKLFGCLWFQSVTLLDISATQIRSIIASGRSPQFLLPDVVLAFIREHQLYQHPPI